MRRVAHGTAQSIQTHSVKLFGCPEDPPRRTLPATPVYTWIARVLSIVYFAFFILMPWYTKIDKCKPEPDRVTFH